MSSEDNDWGDYADEDSEESESNSESESENQAENMFYEAEGKPELSIHLQNVDPI